MLQVFESHADLLGPELFETFCIPSLVRIRTETVKKLEDAGIPPVPMVNLNLDIADLLTCNFLVFNMNSYHGLQIVFAKGAHYAIEEISKLEYNVVGLDWTIDPAVARKLAVPGTVFQGNLDPVALFGDKVSLTKCQVTNQCSAPYVLYSFIIFFSA
jgi:uroporphyrinogen decarboxylase